MISSIIWLRSMVLDPEPLSSLFNLTRNMISSVLQNVYSIFAPHQVVGKFPLFYVFHLIRKRLT